MEPIDFDELSSIFHFFATLWKWLKIDFFHFLDRGCNFCAFICILHKLLKNLNFSLFFIRNLNFNFFGEFLKNGWKSNSIHLSNLIAVKKASNGTKLVTKILVILLTLLTKWLKFRVWLARHLYSTKIMEN